MRKQGDNAVELFPVRIVEPLRQSVEKCDLVCVQCAAVHVEPLCHPDAAAATPDRFDWIRAGQDCNIPADRFPADAKFMRQIASCVMPPEA